MRNLTKTFCKWQWFLCLSAGLCLLSCKDDPKTGVPKYDPSKPVVLESFYPRTGPIATQVILVGENFGDNAEDVRVWFNQKRAAVISAKGSRMLVLAPKLPGDECVISVVIGSDSTWYKNDVFDYIIQTSITTLAGGDTGATEMPVGTTQLSTAQFSAKTPYSMAIDADDNLFFVINSAGTYHFYLANEEEDKLRLLAKHGVAVGEHMVSYNLRTNNAYRTSTLGSDNSYAYFDHTSEFADVSAGSITWDKSPSGNGWADWSARKVMTMRPSDGKFYWRGNEGQFVRFDPDSGIGENLAKNTLVPYSGGTTMGFVFDPRDDNIIYFSVDDRHCIYKYDLTKGETESGKCVVFAGRENISGYLDGTVNIAQFNQPCQMCVDPSDNSIYIADRQNHCIRRISLENGYVATVAGIPRTSGYINGTAEVARLNQPMGIAINSEGIIYIGDSENNAIRRLAIE